MSRKSLCAPSAQPKPARVCVHILVDRQHDDNGYEASDDLRVVLVSPGQVPSDVLTLEGAAKGYGRESGSLRWLIPQGNPYILYREVVELYAGVSCNDVSITVSQVSGACGLDAWEKCQAKKIVV